MRLLGNRKENHQFRAPTKTRSTHRDFRRRTLVSPPFPKAPPCIMKPAVSRLKAVPGPGSQNGAPVRSRRLGGLRRFGRFSMRLNGGQAGRIALEQQSSLKPKGGSCNTGFFYMSGVQILGNLWMSQDGTCSANFEELEASLHVPSPSIRSSHLFGHPLEEPIV